MKVAGTARNRKAVNEEISINEHNPNPKLSSVKVLEFSGGKYILNEQLLADYGTISRLTKNQLRPKEAL